MHQHQSAPGSDPQNVSTVHQSDTMTMTTGRMDEMTNSAQLALPQRQTSSGSSSLSSGSTSSGGSGGGFSAALRDALPTSSAAVMEQPVAAGAAGNGDGGYDYEFSPTVDQRFICPICMLVMSRPVQTPCGHRFCSACISQWISGNTSSDCPTCKNLLVKGQLFADNFANREIMSLTVKCPNVKIGCTQIIELRNIQLHISMECLYALCPCPNRCNAILLKKDLEHHLMTACQSRKLRCTLCDETVPVQNKELHLVTCPKMLSVCSWCGMKLPRAEVIGHQDTQCPLKVVPCFFQPFGCEHECTRESIGSHMDHEKVFHLHLLGEELLKFRKTIFKQAPNIASTPYHAGAGMNLDSSDILLFKPSESGQKLIDSVTCSTVAMTNVGSSSFSVGQTVLTTDPGFVSDVLASAFTSPVWTGSPLMSSSANQPAVMSEAVFPRQTHRERELERTVCLLQRTVSDQAARIAILEQKLGDPEDLIARQNIGAYVWQISDVARRRSDVTTRGTSAATVHSPCFYTSATGYKLCLRVNLNGVDSGTGRFLAIFVHVNRGTFDSVIDWPFAGVITLRVIDQSDVVGTARQHIVESLEAKPGLAAFQRPLSARNHRGFGFVEFAPLSVLDNARYVRNDTLIIHAIAKEASLSSRT